MKAYQIGGHRFYSDLICRRLDRFAVPADGLPATIEMVSKPLQTIFQGTSLVAGSERQVSCVWGPGGYRLTLSGIGTLSVAADGGTILVQDHDPRASESVLFEALVGPLLLLAMATCGTFSLHASAVRGDLGAVLFIGRSRVGKSTLAGDLDSAPDPRWRRITDDIAPVHCLADAHAVVVRSDYPQPKLTAREQPGVAMAATVPVAAVCLLDARGREDSRVSLERVGEAEAAVELVRFTVASRLFSPALLARHLSFCSEAAAVTPLYRLAYPWEEGAPARVSALLEDRLLEDRLSAEKLF